MRPGSIRRWWRGEKDVLADKFKAQGKPANVIEKIVESGLKTFYKEVCLLEQAYVHDSGKNVAQALKEAEGIVADRSRSPGLCATASAKELRAGKRLRREVAAAAGQS